MTAPKALDREAYQRIKAVAMQGRETGVVYSSFGCGFGPCLYTTMQQGRVAQLGERGVRNAEVEGSNPFASTIHPLPVSAPLALSGIATSTRFRIPCLEE